MNNFHIVCEEKDYIYQEIHLIQLRLEELEELQIKHQNASALQELIKLEKRRARLCSLI